MTAALTYNLLSSKQRILATIALCLATFMFVLDYTIANVAIPYIAGSLGISAEQGTYVITFFAVGNALGLPLTGWLSRRFGGIKTLTYSIALFTLFSILCGVSQTLLQIVFFRFLQGLTAGPIVPLSQNCIAMVFPPKKLGMAMGIFSMIVLVAPVFGPIIGGIICTDYYWAWIFFINIPFGIFCFVAIIATLAPHENKTEKLPLDKFGFFCLFLGAASLQIVLDKGEQWDWGNSNLVCVLAILAVISFFYLYLNCRLKKKPLLDLDLWKTSSYALSVFAMFFIYGVYIATVVIVPFWLQVFMGYTAYLAGLAVCTIGIIPVLFSILVIKLIEKIGCLVTIIIGVIIMACVSFTTMYYTTNVDIQHIAFSRAMVGFGLMFWMPPIFKLAMAELKKERIPMALGMLHFFRALSGGIGTSIAMTIFKRRAIFHHANLVGNFNEYREGSKAFMYKIKSLGLTPIQTRESISRAIEQQASMLSFNDVFFAMGLVFIILAVILLLFYKKVGHLR